MVGWQLTVLTVILLASSGCHGYMPHLTPFFFLCNYHGHLQSQGVERGEVAISVSIQGNPAYYVPGALYNVSVTSSMTFDGFLLTGLYTLSTVAEAQLVGRLPHGRSAVGTNLMCSVVHSQISPRPQRTLTFLWLAPPSGTGCVSFLATATLGIQLLFKDTTVLQLCEEGDLHTGPLRPELAEIHTNAVILRDDFDSDSSFKPDLWLHQEGGAVGTDCGSVMFGNAAVFCQSTGIREMVTVPLNTTTARNVQFALSTGSCGRPDSSDPDIVVSYGLRGCTSWVEVERIRAPRGQETETHLVTLPEDARQENVCLRWRQELPRRTFPETSGTNIIVTTTIPVVVATTIPATSTATTTTKATTSSPTTAFARPTTVSTTPTTASTTPTTTSTTPTTTSTTPTTTSTTPTTASTIPTTASTTPTPASRMLTSATQGFTTERDPTLALPDLDPQDDPNAGSEGYQSCWAVDNVLVVNTAQPPSQLQEDFDPIDPGQWLFFPGARIKSHCQSDENAMTFDLSNQTYNFAVTRDLDLSPTDPVADRLLFEEFEHKEQPGWTVDGGRPETLCGEVHYGNAMTFDSEGTRQACTPYLDLPGECNLRFYMQMGGGGFECQASVGPGSSVRVRTEDTHGHGSLLLTLYTEDFQSARFVSMNFRPAEKGEATRVCWQQRYHEGQGQDVWALDDVEVLPYLPQQSLADKDRILQFSINPQCGGDLVPNTVAVEFSVDHGGTWGPLHQPCTPSSCEGHYQPLSSSVSSSQLANWGLLTFPLPYAALAPDVRFRWMLQDGASKPNWALDKVYIGSCPEGCNGHGVCDNGNCRCEFSYTGPGCAETVVPSPWEMLENFEDPSVVHASSQVRVRGGHVGFTCGVLAKGKALVLDGEGPRELLTGDLNTTSAQYLQFSVRVGSPAKTSRCPPPDNPGETVLLEASCKGGMEWTLLREFSTAEYSDPRMESVILPNNTRGDNCRFRWRQPHHSGRGRDVWAVDDISLSEELPNTLAIDPGELLDIGDRLTANLGKLQDSFCGAPRSIVFLGSESNGAPRFLMTEAVAMGPSYMAQFDLVMGCGDPFSKGIDNQVYLEFSVNHGLTWQLLQPPCLPPDPCGEFQSGSVYHASRYPQWTSLTVPVPRDAWSPSTRLRWRQPEWREQDSWALRRVYVGQQCPHMCHGHGVCNYGVCKCEAGFHGDNCEPEQPMATEVRADFGMRYSPGQDFHSIIGGEVARTGLGCGIILSGESVYFYKDGVRELVSKDLNTENADYLQFYLRVGGGEGADEHCRGAEKREESVLLQHSPDGGVTWQLLEELLHDQYREPKFVHVELPEEARTHSTRFRWWQPRHDGKGQDQWAVDEIAISQHRRLRQLQDDFDGSVDPQESGLWQTLTEGVVGKYCQPTINPALVLGNQRNHKLALTQDLALQPGDVVQFRINVGCEPQFRWDHPVYLQYSHDGGRTWRLLEEPCYQDMDCEGSYTEGSIYWPGTHGQWSLQVIPVTEQVAMHPVVLRWWQPGGMAYSFALDDVYIGPACPQHCHKQGLCRQGVCQCLQGDPEDVCSPGEAGPTGMLDRFDNRNQPDSHWDRILGGHLGRGCGTVDSGNSLYFGDEGPRQALTQPLDTTSLRLLQFVVKIGDDLSSDRCRQPEDRTEGVILDYSTDHGVTWSLLRLLEPALYGSSTQTVRVQLPPATKTNATIFRWWQPLGLGGTPRAGWALDSVMVGVNDSSSPGFNDDFSGMMANPRHWFMADSAVSRAVCSSSGNALEFSANTGRRYAETWDYHVTPSTFLQFELAMGCGLLYGGLYSIMLEYSVDAGKSWRPVIEECSPPDFHCPGYSLSSQYSSPQHMNWTRVTVALPPGAVSPATRFRWLQHTSHPRGTVWALDNVYLGNGCAWLCSGHGFCREEQCVCDPGFGGPHCVPAEPLPMMLRDDFNGDDPDPALWTEVYGGDVTGVCGTVVSGNSLTFHKGDLRVAMTRDLDTSMLTGAEFYFRYGCGEEDEVEWPRSHSVLFQYSNNGGISWSLVHEIHFHDHSQPKFFSVPLPMNARTNATRFRFWQPQNDGEMKSTWSVDNLFIGAMPINPSAVSDDFEGDRDADTWLFVNDGVVDQYCHFKTGPDTVGSGQTALVFRRQPGGTHSAVTRDLDVGPMSVLQFDINVGCGAAASEDYPVRLEYSADGGKTWSLLADNCAERSPATRCFDAKLPPSVYYAGTSPNWRRVVIPLENIHVCGPLRFRWHQGRIPDDAVAPEWALDSVFIGMMCMDHCHGHGRCDGMRCHCDAGYHGDTCVPQTPLPKFAKDDFRPVDIELPRPVVIGPLLPLQESSSPLLSDIWLAWGGGEATLQCGPVFHDHSLLYDNPGERQLVMTDLDLSSASMAQFYLKLGCGRTVDNSASPVLLQYSTDGGVHWNSLEQFHYDAAFTTPAYVALHLPAPARTNSTRLRWWQPSSNGQFPEAWAIDQVYVGGDVGGEELLQDEPSQPRDSVWLMTPGAATEKACGSQGQVLHFAGEGQKRYAVTADADVRENTFLQFFVAVGCGDKDGCYSVRVEYSLDMGKSWSLLLPACLPSQLDCASFHPPSLLHSDTQGNWTRVSLPLPYYARSEATRFRWFQPPGFSTDQSWALSHLYLGNQCPDMCSGHGTCRSGNCNCDDGWAGHNCGTPTTTLPRMLSDDFAPGGVDGEAWLTLEGGSPQKPCRVMAAGHALHFTGGCNRVLTSRDLDLSTAQHVQFVFMYGCNAAPVSRDQGVLLDYSSDGGIHWQPLSELHYNLFKQPSFVTIKIPAEAKQTGVRLRWWQPSHGGPQLGDWLIDSLRVNGDDDNPRALRSNVSNPLREGDFVFADNVAPGEYCGGRDVAVGTTQGGEASQVATRELALQPGDVLQFFLAVGCDSPSNASVPPVHLQFSTDHGVTWNPVTSLCLTSDPECSQGPTMPSVFYQASPPEWHRVQIPLRGLPVSSGTRFRWVQPPEGLSAPAHWGLRDVYIGPPCRNHCGGHGTCEFPYCECDEGYAGPDCHPIPTYPRPKELKDTFDNTPVNTSRWLAVQGGDVTDACALLVEKTALVFHGPGIHQAVTTDLDLQDASFVQYTAAIGGESGGTGCFTPDSPDDSVILQYSTDGGLSWSTLHTLDYSRYLPPRADYIPLPPAARTPSTRLRWWQPAPSTPRATPRPQWALDNVLIGGTEINPASLHQDFNETEIQGDAGYGGEFSPHGGVEVGVCGGEDGALLWPQGQGQRSYTTGQLIVQHGYMLQFRIVIGCQQQVNACVEAGSVQLQYNRNPRTDHWELVRPACLPDVTSGVECLPNAHHASSVYHVTQVPEWTLVTIELPPATFSGSTRFRWVQTGDKGTQLLAWALDDVYVGPLCTDLCNGRGLCVDGSCQCEKGYQELTCKPSRAGMVRRMLETFEGGVFRRLWQEVRGGEVGRGCGALLPFAHGKSLYFSHCGERQATTAQMDLTYAAKVIFVLQIGCPAQTQECNVKLGEGPDYRGVLLQYTTNKGIDWHFLARHDPEEFLRPRRVAYDLPAAARTVGTQLRWWQPVHDGEGHDQWAIDHVEIALGRSYG